MNTKTNDFNAILSQANKAEFLSNMAFRVTDNNDIYLKTDDGNERLLENNLTRYELAAWIIRLMLDNLSCPTQVDSMMLDVTTILECVD